MSGDPIAAHFCGQQQPHNAHDWQTPPVYGATTITSQHQCAGLTPAQPHETGDADA